MNGRDPLILARGLLIAIPIAVALWVALFVGFVTVYDLPPMRWSTAR